MPAPAHEHEILALQAKLRAAETYDGEESLAAAECLEEYASYLRANKIKLLEAANALARAEMIRSKLPEPINRRAAESAGRKSNSPKRNGFGTKPENGKKSSNDQARDLLNDWAENDKADKGDKNQKTGDKKCPFCAEYVKEEAVVCKHCYSDLAAGKRTSPPYAFNTSDPVIIFRAEGPRPIVAALLSCLIPGTGHIYIREVPKGVFIFFLFVACVLFCPMMVGAVLAPILWIIGIISSMRSARKKRQRSELTSGWY